MVLSAKVVAAAMAAGRQALENYSEFDSGMVPDSALNLFVVDVLTAAYKVLPPAPVAPAPAPQLAPPPKAQS